MIARTYTSAEQCKPATSVATCSTEENASLNKKKVAPVAGSPWHALSNNAPMVCHVLVTDLPLMLLDTASQHRLNARMIPHVNLGSNAWKALGSHTPECDASNPHNLFVVELQGLCATQVTSAMIAHAVVNRIVWVNVWWSSQISTLVSLSGANDEGIAFVVSPKLKERGGEYS